MAYHGWTADFPVPTDRSGAALQLAGAPAFAELLESATISGEGLLALARDETSTSLRTKIQDDGYSIEPWVVMVQAINHATEHREQIKNMLSALGVTPPRLDGGAYGRVANAVIPIST
jgi:uncharacterized damage-inducible protein DinB